MDRLPTKHLRALLVSEHWDKMEDYLAVEKDRLVNQLCNCNEVLEIRKIQGQIAMLKQIAALRENLKAEEGRR